MLGKVLDRFRKKGTSRPRSKAETEKRRRLFIVFLIVLAVLSSVSVVGYGYYDTKVKPWHEPIVKVNGTVIEMRDFVKTTRTWVLLAGMSYNSMISPASPAWMEVYEMLYSSEISSYSDLVPAVATRMEEDELMRQGLEYEFPDVDIAALTSDEAVEAAIRAMLVSDNATDDQYSEQYDNFLTNLKSFELSEKDFQDLFTRKLLIREELKKQLKERDFPVTRNFDHAQVQALLITGADNATAVRNQWIGAADQDAEFQLLTADNATYKPVKEYAKVSTDNTTPVWVAKGIESTAFDNYTFSVELGSGIGQPFLDDEGSGNYWVIKVIDRQSRPLSDSDRSTLSAEAFSQWLEGAKNSEENDIVYYLSEKGGEAKQAWAVDHITVSTG